MKIKNMLESHERHNEHFEVLKAKYMANEIPEEMKAGVQYAIEEAELELEPEPGKKGKLSKKTADLLEKLYNFIKE